MFRDGVVEDELGRAVDEDAGGVWHARRLAVRCELGTFFSGLVFWGCLEVCFSVG